MWAAGIDFHQFPRLMAAHTRGAEIGDDMPRESEETAAAVRSSKKNNAVASPTGSVELCGETEARKVAFSLPQAVGARLVGGVFARDSYASTAIVEIVDRALHASIARASAGISPGALGAAYFDWFTHLAFSPGKQMQLAQKAVKKAIRLNNYALRCCFSGSDECCIEPLPQDKRFSGEAWRRWPFNLISQSFLLTQQWWHNATVGVRGVTPQHERVVEFVARQLLDVIAPSNFITTNPEVLQKTIDEKGANLFRGRRNYLEDAERAASGRPPVGADEFKVGERVAVTPGVVVFRNRLIELIQYAPAMKTVYADPILITPAWIMKYYVLDLSPRNSLVKHLVDHGHSVFMISWKNPGPEDRDLSFDDYRKLGVVAALDAIEAIIPGAAIHGVGYCLGGTLLGVTSAAMSRAGDQRFKSLTFLAAQFDFSEPGELGLFMNESQVTFLEDVMWEQGFLDTKQMAGAFQLLRSNDLIWSRLEHDYLMGERRPMTDLAAWNADATRMPYRMHSEYLRRFYLDNDLAEGRFDVDGETVALSDIRIPIFAVATTRDHVAPWRSVFKVHLLTDTEVTFLLAAGGHNAGIVSEPGHPRQQYRAKVSGADDFFLDPELWALHTKPVDGPWWPVWETWLAERSGVRVEPPRPQWISERGGVRLKTNEAMPAAPGTYVLAA